MNKEQAIEILKDQKECWSIYDELKGDEEGLVNELIEERIQALDIAIESLDNEWVDVRDRLPEDRERVLVSDDTMFVTDCNYTDDLYELDNNDFAKYKGKSKWGFYYYIKDMGFLEFDSVLAWKPLPQPYERKE